MKKSIRMHIGTVDELCASNAVLQLNRAGDRETELCGTNHDDDLRRLAINFIGVVVGKKWNQFEAFVLADHVCLHGHVFSRHGTSSIISFFQDAHSQIELTQLTIQNIHVDLVNRKAAVRADIMYCATRHGLLAETVEGPCILHYAQGPINWDIVQLEIPGL